MGYLALQLPSFQTRAARIAARSVSERLGTEVTIGKVYYIFFNRLIANNLVIMQNETDTLLGAEKISVKLSAKELLKGNIRIDHLTLNSGVFNIIHETDSTTGLDRIFGGSEKKEDNGSGIPEIFAGKLTISNFRFNMINPFSPEFENGQNSKNHINFSNLALSDIYIEISAINYDKTLLSANINQLSFSEKSGFRAEEFSGILSVSPGKIAIEDFIIRDLFSRIEATSFSLSFDNMRDFSDFTQKVVFDANFNNSVIDFRTLAKFAPDLYGNNLALNINGLIQGPVSNLRTQNLKVASESGLTYLDLNARISGLPNTDITIFFLDINNSTTTTTDLSYIIASINGGKPVEELKTLSPFVKYNFKGGITGLLGDMVANGKITSNIGSVHLDAQLKNNTSNGGLDLNGTINTYALDIGRLLQNKTLGELTLSSKISALLRNPSAGGSEFYIDTLFINSFTLNNYPYRNITANGSYLNNTFDGKVICRDPNLDLLFQGIIGISSEIDSYYDFYADVIYADLAALNFDNRDTISAISFTTMANFTQNIKGDIDGTLNVRGLNFTNSKGHFPIGDISVQSSSTLNNHSIFLRSAFANATFRGTDFFTGFIDKVLDISLHSNLYAVFPKKEPGNISQENKYSLSVDFNDTRAISQMLLPGLSISEGTTLRVEVSENDSLSLDIASDQIGFDKSYTDNISIKLRGSYNMITAGIYSDRIHFAGIGIDSSRVTLNLKNNLLNIRSEYTNRGDLKNRLDFGSEVLFTAQQEGKSPIIDLSIFPSELFINGLEWSVAGSKIVKHDTTFVFHNFSMFRENQNLHIDGIISHNPTDTFSLILNNIDLSPLNTFMSDQLGFEGRFTGRADAVDLYNQPQIIMDITGEDISVYGKRAGTLQLISEWDNLDKVFNIYVINSLDNRNPFSISGTFRPEGNYLKLDATLDNMSPSYFEPFLTDIISATSGGISGRLTLEGALSSLNLYSNNTTLNDLSFLVDFTNVTYTLNGPVILNENGVNLNNVAIKDRFGNTGRITGGIIYNHFMDLAFNTSVNFTRMEVLNTREQDNSDFYGNAFGTGRITISGPISRLLMDIFVTTNRNTSIHIPLTSATTVYGKNLLTFLQPISHYAENGAQTEKEKPSQGTELQVILTANMTPDAAMLIEIDKSVGDIITGYGNGLITLDINPSRDIFSIQGDYFIQRGSYKFVLQGFIERDFTIAEGGNISFNGDINRTNLNLTANYRTKAAINPLISDTSSIASRRTVDCQINMTGPLMNPRLSFDIDIPDIDPITKARVNAALNTEDKVVKQVMSLLVSGSFIPDVQSSIVNNSTLLYSNATEVLSNQINKIFNQLEIPLDLSFNYQPGQNGRDLFDAAVSAQLFNNRVIVNGNIGSARYMEKAGDVVGDLDVEIKLDERGRFRAKAFSHSADQYSNYLDNSQRNGLGLVYQEEFSSFRELINNLFTSRRRRKRLMEEEMAAIRPREDNLILPDLISEPPVIRLP